MDSKDKIDNILRKIRGEIISEAVLVELDLTTKLSYYFFNKNSEKSHIFYWEILNTKNLGFDDKIRIFKRIPSFKKWKKYPEIVQSLTFVQNLRNQLAHWDIRFNKSNQKKIIIYDPITLKERVIDAGVLEEFDDAIVKIHKYMCKNIQVGCPELKSILEKKIKSLI